MGDDVTVPIPDRPGDRRVDGAYNIVATGRIRMLFMILLWPGYSLAADHRHRPGSRSVTAITHDYRVLWMRRMLELSNLCR